MQKLKCTTYLFVLKLINKKVNLISRLPNQHPMSAWLGYYLASIVLPNASISSGISYKSVP